MKRREFVADRHDVVGPAGGFERRRDAAVARAHAVEADEVGHVPQRSRHERLGEAQSSRPSATGSSDRSGKSRSIT